MEEFTPLVIVNVGTFDEVFSLIPMGIVVGLLFFSMLYLIGYLIGYLYKTFLERS